MPTTDSCASAWKELPGVPMLLSETVTPAIPLPRERLIGRMALLRLFLSLCPASGDALQGPA